MDSLCCFISLNCLHSRFKFSCVNISHIMSEASLTSVAEELSDVTGTILETFTCSEAMAVDILEYSCDPERDLKELKEQLESLAEAEKEIAAFRTVISEINAVVSEDRERTPDKISAKVDKYYQSALSNQSLNPRAEQIIATVNSYLNEPQISEEFEDSDGIIVTAATECFKDPLTKLIIQNPVKSKVCGHSYEKKSILKYLDRKRKCPYSGCVSTLSRDDLIEDLEMKGKLLNMR